MGASSIPISDDHIQAGTADSVKGSPGDIAMAEVDGESDPGEANRPQTHTEDGDDEYFEVEDIRSCKLGPRVRRFSRSLYLF
jgi:hypothetical protein